MAVDLQGALIGAFFHGGGNHADHPHNAQDVIRVLVGYKNMVDAA